MQRFTNTFSIKFYCRASRVAADGTAPVELAINLQGERFISHLPRRAKPNEFEKLMHGRKSNDLKEYLSAIEFRLRTLETVCYKEGEPFTLDVIKRFIKAGYSRETVTLGLLRDEYLVSLRHKLEAGAISEKRYRKYEIAWDHFMTLNGFRPSQLAAEVKNKDIMDFKYKLQEKNFEPSTIAGFLHCVKVFFNYGQRNGYISRNPYDGFVIGKKTKEVRFLTDEEVERIKTVRLPSDKLERVRDLFLFQCRTALSYVDMSLLEPEDFKKDNQDGILYINKRRRKNGMEFFVVVLPEPLAIAQKYDFRLPIISCQRYNDYLKEIGTLCGIEKPMHSHIARHTAATWLLNHSVPMPVVQKCLGHQPGSPATRHYAKLLDRSVIDEMKKLF